ncbi:hypothetical protein ACHWQZ_G019391 [Mnemiopsis leidyi]
MVEHALSRQGSQDKNSDKQEANTLTFKYQVGDFTVFESNFGHPDISMSVGIVKKFDLIVRKYFCNKEIEFDQRISFGELLNTRSNLRFMPDCDDMRLALVIMAQKRNDFLRDFRMDKFDSEAFRRCFIDVANIVLLELKKMVLRPKPIDQARKKVSDSENHVKVVYKAAELNDPESDIPDLIKTRFKIREVVESASREDLIRFHCWKMVKLDPGLQESIKKDEDDLFYQLLPMSVKDYVAIVPC